MAKGQSKALLRAFHAACGAAGMTTDDKKTLVASYGVESSTMLSDEQLREAIRLVSGANEGDKWRKRVIRVVDAYLRGTGHAAGVKAAKAVACRAAGYENFNRIPTGRLQNIYYAFLNKNRDMEAVEEMAQAQAWCMGLLGGAKKSTVC